MTTFSELGLIQPLLRAVAEEGYAVPTPIQARAIPTILQGRDVLGIAQTGTGKTAAFTLPILQRLAELRRRPAPRSAAALVLTPTRELALQIGRSFADYGRHLGLSRTVVYGGVGQGAQVSALARGVDVLVATPGRLLDLIEQGHVTLDAVSVFVLDEADRMLDMGFIHDMRKIVRRLPKQRQTLLFSATMPTAVTELASGLLRDFDRVEVTPSATTVERVDQRVLFVARTDKNSLLRRIFEDRTVLRAIVFSRTKRGANRIAEHLKKAGVNADAIHGNKSQNARVRTLADFQSGRVRALVATDIAARGLDIDGITHIINFDMPNEPEGYVHRVGRTARAGADGIALSFCDAEEVPYLAAIEKVIRRTVPVDAGHGFHAPEIARRHGQGAAAPKQNGSGQNGSGQHRSGRNGSGRKARPGGHRFNGRSAHRGRAVPAGRHAAG